MDEENKTVELVLAEVVGTEARRIVQNGEESNAKEMEGLSKVVDSLTKAKESEANSDLEYEKLKLEQARIDLEYDRMEHEKEIEKSRSFTDTLKSGATILGIVAGAALGVYTADKQSDLVKSQMEFDLAMLEDMTRYEDEGIYTSQASRQVINRLGKRTLPNLIQKALSFIKF